MRIVAMVDDARPTPLPVIRVVPHYDPHRGMTPEEMFRELRASYDCDYCGAYDPGALAVWINKGDSFRLCPSCAIKLRNALIQALGEP